jgi:antitoxin ParD1/3/4
MDAGIDRGVDNVVEEALEAREERNRLAPLRAAIAVGDAQLARGEGIPYSSELMDEIEREAEEAYRRDEQPGPDVCP